jgi:hypothetical protein
VKERWWLGPGADQRLGPRTAWTIPEWMHAEGEVLSTDRDSAAVRVPDAKGALLVKWRVVAPGRRWRWWLRASRERGEARGLPRARARGIDLPSPLAVGERRDVLSRLVAAVMVRPFIEGFANAAEALGARGGDALIAPLARALRGWHDAGWRHGDAWPKNFLITRDGARAAPIGAPKAFVVAKGVRLDAGRLDDLAHFAAGIRLSAAGRDPFAFVHEYLARPGLPPRVLLEARLRPRLERILAKRAEDERTRPQREPQGPPSPTPLPLDAVPVKRGGLAGA